MHLICSTTFFLNKTQGLTFLSRNLYGWVGYILDIKFQNSEFAVLSLAKLPSDLFFGEICLTKLKDFTFLSRNLYGREPLGWQTSIFGIFF
jgi:hypothetical protein